MTTLKNKRTRFFVKIYLSHFILERVDVGYMWEVSWRRRETATYWPQVPLTIAALLPHSAGLLNWGPEGPSPLSGAGSHSGIFSPTGTATRTSTELSQAVCGTRLYNYLTYTCFLWAYASAPNSTTSTGPSDIPISSTGCTCFLIDGSVEGQYVTRWLTNFHDFKFKSTATAAIGIHLTKAWLSQLVNFKNAIWHFRRTICHKILF